MLVLIGSHYHTPRGVGDPFMSLNDTGRVWLGDLQGTADAFLIAAIKGTPHGDYSSTCVPGVPEVTHVFQWCYFYDQHEFSPHTT